MDPKATSTSKTDNIDQITIIEEKVNKIGTEPTIRKYSKGRMLGKGGFAKCYEVTNLENKKVLAGKIICKASLTKSRAKQKLISEIKIHKSLRHSNIVEFEHVFEDQENVYILLELCPNQSLHDLIKRRKRLTEIEVQCYTLQLICGLKYLHSRRVIHRDLKLGNLLLNDKMELKICDFGLAAKLEFDGEKRKTVCGTPNYIAPEVIEGKGGHSYEVDTWSLGVIIYTLLVGRPPFETSDVKQTYKRIKACEYSFPDHVSVSDTAKNLVQKMLTLDPSKRPSLDEILQHPFLKNANNIPKFLPASTLACPPSTSYLNQFASPENSVKVPSQPAPKSAEATPLAAQKNGRFINTQGSNMFGSEKTLVTSPHSATTQAHTNENVVLTSQLDRHQTQGEKGWNFTKTGSWQSNLNGTQSVKGSSRPQTVQQKGDLKSAQSLKAPALLNNLGSRLRVSGSAVGSNRGQVLSGNEVWVKKWVDYSSKYGMGYNLSNGTTGVFFNDNTKIVFNQKTDQVTYIQRGKNDRQDTVTHYSLTEYPKDLQKKMTLLQHFKKYLEGSEYGGSESINDGTETQIGVYVKKWVKTKNATLFRLSNKTVQVHFTDRTEIILNSENKQVTYVARKETEPISP
uniref:Probable serine/threonine-protein kinase CCRP1 n=1 Tax=Zea mays TaxID=4577 RepID=CCR1_MAIZE|nr:RecName: Full=Probable serine/threonine-protein kinase CCRP1; AltName: Full=Cell-cycle related Protein 1 [Zea mays]